jgi:ketosteroid isomerase-like protein
MATLTPIVGPVAKYELRHNSKGQRRTAVRSELSTSRLIHSYYAAYEGKDRRAIEALLADDFTFCSPLDDHIDRAAYFFKCWPNCAKIRAFHIEKLFAKGNEAFVLYDLEPTAGPNFRNTEFFRTRGNKIREVEVYFGSAVGTVGVKE